MLLRGVNKQIIEINETDDMYFEKAVLYVRPEYADGKAAELSESAHDFLKKLNMSENANLPWNNSKSPKDAEKRFSGKKLIIGSLVLSAAIVAGIFMVILRVL